MPGPRLNRSQTGRLKRLLDMQYTVAELAAELGVSPDAIYRSHIPAGAPDGNIEVTIPGESGLFLVVPGLLLTNSLVVKAFAATANVVCVHGFVNRITA